MKKIMLIATTILLSGCSAKYSSTVLQNKTETLVKNEPITIAVPADGAYNAKPYVGSGLMTAQAVRSAFATYSDNITVVEECAKLDCLSQSQQVHSGYLVVPEILHWEDRATEWSGIPDAIKIKITVYKAADSKRISSIILDGKSSINSMGGDHPQDLLAKPITDYTVTLY